MSRRYVHVPLGEEVRAIGGGYELVEEVRLQTGGREALALIGVGMYDTSCCGIGGCAYALIPGFVLAWHEGTSDDGHPVTRVEPITHPGTRDDLTRSLRARWHVQDVRFWGPEP